MSLVITLHDQDVGIAVSEGRAGWTSPDGQFIPVAENRIKTSYLPDGSILGCTGNGIVHKLRAAIEAKAAAHTFPELLDIVVPEMVEGYRAKYPDDVFGVTLMGNDSGTIRSRTWNDRGENASLGETMTSSVLGLDGDTHDEAAQRVRDYLTRMRKDYLNLGEATKTLKDIICDLAQRHLEINDRLDFKSVIAPSVQESEDLKPLGNGASTRTKEIFDLDRLLSAGANVTARHVLTSPVKVASTQLNGTISAPQALSGFGWTTTTANTGDTYNITGLILQSDPQATLSLFIDGNTGTNYVNVIPNYQGTSVVGWTVFASISGLSPGTHTIQFYLTAPNTPVAGWTFSGWASCQRIF